MKQIVALAETDAKYLIIWMRHHEWLIH